MCFLSLCIHFHPSSLLVFGESELQGESERLPPPRDIIIISPIYAALTKTLGVRSVLDPVNMDDDLVVHILGRPLRYGSMTSLGIT